MIIKEEKNKNKNKLPSFDYTPQLSPEVKIPLIRSHNNSINFLKPIDK